MSEDKIKFEVFVGYRFSLFIWISTMISLRISLLKEICYLFSKGNENLNIEHMSPERVDGTEIECRWLN